MSTLRSPPVAMILGEKLFGMDSGGRSGSGLVEVARKAVQGREGRRWGKRLGA